MSQAQGPRHSGRGPDGRTRITTTRRLIGGFGMAGLALVSVVAVQATAAPAGSAASAAGPAPMPAAWPPPTRSRRRRPASR